MARQYLVSGYGTAIIFFFLFSFRLPVVYNSAVLAVLVCLCHLSFRISSLKTLEAIFLNKYYLWLNAMVVIFFAYSSLITTLHGEYDYSFLSLVASYGFYVVAAPIVFTSIYVARAGRVEDAIFNAFLLQSIIIVVAFASPSVRDALRVFKDETQLEIADSYYGGGLRGLALSGGLFFSLSCGYCIYFFVLVRKMLEQRINYFVAMLVLISLFSAVTAGRTALLGMAFAGATFIYLALQKEAAPYGKTNLLRIISIIFSAMLVIFIAVPFDVLLEALDGYMKFSFEMVFNFLEGKGLTTSSTDRLNEMYFALDAGQLLVGDGRYSSATGGYYRETDAGYMRNVLLGGLPGVFLAVAQLVVWLVAMRRYDISQANRQRVGWVISVGVAIMVLTLHYKGEALLYVIMINNLLYLLFFGRLFRERQSGLAPSSHLAHLQR